MRPLSELALSASYFRIDYKDRVAPPLASGAGVLDNPIYADLVTRNPAPALLDAIFDGADGGLQNITGALYDPARVVAQLPRCARPQCRTAKIPRGRCGRTI